jgi:hypothetical protein
MQARIKRADIEAFKTNASAIPRHDDNPILQFLKITVEGDFATLTKLNFESFVIHTIPNDSEDCSFLVDEKILFEFIQLPVGEYVNFNIEKNRILIYDERYHSESPTERPELYLGIDTSNNEWTPIPKAALTAIGIAAEIVFGDEIQGARNTVFVGDGWVAGSDATIGYKQAFKEPLPKLCLRKKVATAISKLSKAEHSFNTTFDLFRDNHVLLGFRKSEIRWMELAKVFGEPDPDPDFILNKHNLIKWNTFCINSCKSKFLTSKWVAEGNRLNLVQLDEKYEISNRTHFDIIDGSGEFVYNPETFNQLLKVLPADTLYFHSGPFRIFLTDMDRSFVAAIMLIDAQKEKEKIEFKEKEKKTKEK